MATESQEAAHEVIRRARRTRAEAEAAHSQAKKAPEIVS